VASADKEVPKTEDTLATRPPMRPEPKAKIRSCGGRCPGQQFVTESQVSAASEKADDDNPFQVIEKSAR